MIHPVDKRELPECLEVIHSGFMTAAEEFHLTKENCPTNGAFMPFERLQLEYDSGVKMFVAVISETIVGFAEVSPAKNGVCELMKLCVLPEHRHNGVGQALVNAARECARSMGCVKMSIGIIEENARLKAWYESIGFVHTGTKVFAGLPFTVGFLETRL